MNIREIRVTDLEQIQEIHERFYKTEFCLPDFTANFLCAFVVEHHDRIVLAGGLKKQVELVYVTDKDFSRRERRTALYKGLDVAKYLASRNGYDQLHAFIQDHKWLEVMEKRGFNHCNGTAIYTGVA